MKNILVVGATGDQGHPLLRRLIDAGLTPVCGLRNPDAFKGTEFADVATVHMDLTSEASMIEAAKGMDGIAAHIPFVFDQPLARSFGENIAAAGKANGLKKIVVNTSCYMHDSPIGVSAHEGRLDMEAALFAGPTPCAIFEPKVFMDNIIRSWSKPSIVNNGVFAYPAGPNLKINWTALDDVAAFMVGGLTVGLEAAGQFPIGGPETLLGTDVAERLSIAAGKPITFKSLTPDEFASGMSLLVTGSAEVEPDSMYDRIAEFYRFYNSQPVSPLIIDVAPVAKQFGVTPTPLLEWAKRQDWTDPMDPALALRMAGLQQ